MKKLMIALTAVATAFGLYAAGDGFVSGAGFDSTDADAKYSWVANGLFVAGFWEGVTETTAVLKQGNPNVPNNNRPEEFKAGHQHDGYLKIATTLGNPVTQKVKTSGGQMIGDGFYFDGLVNFTVFDKTDTPTSPDAKLAVYLQLKNDDDESAGTNLIVRALGPNNEAYDFECAEVDVTPGWHRLTIKMIENILTTVSPKQVGFVVYVDGMAASNMEKAKRPFDPAALTPLAALFNDNGQLFASLEGAANTISSVSFDGQGEIDEIVFTTKAPDFAADSIFINVTWDDTAVESMKIGGKTYTGSTNSVAVMVTNNLGEAVYPINYSWIGKNNHMDGNGSITADNAVNPFDLSEQTRQLAKVLATTTTGIKKCADLAAAVDVINDADSGTIKLLDDQTVTAGFTLGKDTTLDLNDQTITFTGAAGTAAFTTTAVLTIKDDGQNKTGKIVVTVQGGLAADPSMGSLTILAGIFDAASAIKQPWNNGSISGGSFKKASDQQPFLYTARLAGGFTAVDTVVNGYWTVVEAPKTWTATVAAATTGVTLENIKTNNVLVVETPTEGKYDIEKGVDVVVTYAVQEGYKITSGDIEQTLSENGTTTSVSPTATTMVYAEIPKITDIFFYKGEAQTAIKDGVGYTVVGGAVQTNAGSYEAEVKLADGYDAWTDKTTANQKISWSIVRAVVTVTADNQTIKVGDAQPEYTAKVTAGEVYASDTLDYTVACPNYKDEEGEYDIVVTSGTNQNYDIMPANGTLKVEAAGPVIPEPEDLPEAEKTAYDNWYTSNPADPTDVALTKPEDLKDAYLLGCKAGEEALEAAREDFKFASIEFKDGEWVATIKNSKGEAHEFYGNGKIRVTRYSDVTCETSSKTGNFFKADLDYKSAE